MVRIYLEACRLFPLPKLITQLRQGGAFVWKRGASNGGYLAAVTFRRGRILL